MLWGYVPDTVELRPPGLSEEALTCARARGDDYSSLEITLQKLALRFLSVVVDTGTLD